MNSWCFKHSICGLKMSIPGSLPVKISSNFFFLEIFIAPKVPPWNFRGSLLSYFSAIARLNSGIFGIFDQTRTNFLGTENRKLNFKLLRGRLGMGASCGKLFTYINRCARKFHIFWYQTWGWGRLGKTTYAWKTGQKYDFTGVEIAWVDMKSNEYPLFYIWNWSA